MIGISIAFACFWVCLGFFGGLFFVFKEGFLKSAGWFLKRAGWSWPFLDWSFLDWIDLL